MKVFPESFGLLAGILSMNNAISAVSREMFYVVSSSSGSEKVYLKSNRLGAIDGESPFGEDVVCDAILRSPFFSYYNDYELFNPIKKTKLVFLHSEISRRLFRRPYELVNVSVLEMENVAEESVFSCVARVKGTDALKLYLVSNEYDFNRVIKRPTPTKCPPTRGRFVFEYRESEEIADLFAVAEEPARRLDYNAIDPTHYEDLKEELNAISERGEKICRFSTERKVRICAVALNAAEYRRDNIRFLPLENKIEPDCEKENLVFKYRSDNQFKFTEWVFGCRAEIVGKPSVATYFVSLGYEPYQFLIYHQTLTEDSHVLLYHFYSHLGTDNGNYTRD